MNLPVVVRIHTGNWSLVENKHLVWNYNWGGRWPGRSSNPGYNV